MAFYFDDEEAGVHAYFPDGEEDAGAEWVRDYLASVTPPAADDDSDIDWASPEWNDSNKGKYDWDDDDEGDFDDAEEELADLEEELINQGLIPPWFSEEDTEDLIEEWSKSANESVTPPAADVTDTSWRAEVVDDAIAEDALEAAAEADMMEIVHQAYAEVEPDYGVDPVGNRIIPLLENGLTLTVAEKWSDWARYKVEKWRMGKKRRRRNALDLGLMIGSSVVYEISPDYTVFEDEIYRVIDPLTACYGRWLV